MLFLSVGNKENCVVVSRYFREDSVLRLLIVKLSRTGWFTPVVFPPHVKDVFHINPCITCALCLCSYSAVLLLVETILKFIHISK
jgi:hypothetical protein